MSEATRAEREANLAVLDAQIEALRAEYDAKIETLEDERRAIPELPEDREWRLAQMDPLMRRVVELMDKQNLVMAKRFADDLKADNLFFQGSQRHVGTELKIRLPEGY